MEEEKMINIINNRFAQESGEGKIFAKKDGIKIEIEKSDSAKEIEKKVINEIRNYENKRKVRTISLSDNEAKMIIALYDNNFGLTGSVKMMYKELSEMKGFKKAVLRKMKN
jgi:hypothetical protein